VIKVSSIFLAADHSTLLSYWRSSAVRRRRLLHFDSHGDLRGAILDRSGKLLGWFPWEDSVDQGNFLLHAAREDLVERVRWVHDELGGRELDMGTLLFADELSTGLRRLMAPWMVPATTRTDLHYEIIPYKHFGGIESDEELDIDWDFFAAEGRSPKDLDRMVEEFFGTHITALPQTTYLVASPDYSPPWSRQRFEQVVERLETLMTCEATILEPPWENRTPSFLSALRRGVRKWILPVKRLVFPTRVDS